MLTDGLSQDSVYLPSRALHRLGVNKFVVGRRTNRRQLTQIASSSSKHLHNQLAVLGGGGASPVPGLPPSGKERVSFFSRPGLGSFSGRGKRESRNMTRGGLGVGGDKWVMRVLQLFY